MENPKSQPPISPPINQTPLQTVSNPQIRLFWLRNKLVLILFVAAILIVVAVGVYVLLFMKQKNSTLVDRNALTNSSNQGTTLTGCSLTGQSATGIATTIVQTKFTNSTEPVDTYSDKTQEIVARVLNTSPFVVEVFDMQNQTNDVIGSLGIQEGMFVDTGEKDKLSQLKFNDIITANLYGFTYASVELAFGTAIKDIQKIDNPNYFNSPNVFANRSGTLLRYTPSNTNSNGFLLVFNDGKVFYRDNNNNTFTDKTLSASELNDILKQFAVVNFDKLSTDFETSLYSPMLVLACNRYQKIPLTGNLSNVQPIIAELDKVIDSYRSNAKYSISYNKKYVIKDWQYSSIVQLDQANNISFRQQNKDKLSKIKPSPGFYKEVQDFNTFYRYGGKLYGVYFGSCVDGTAGTWACFGAEELTSQTTGGRRYNIWPSELSVKLKDISPSGADIPIEEYKAHKDFYDKLLTWDDNLLFLDGDMLYQRLSVSLR